MKNHPEQKATLYHQMVGAHNNFINRIGAWCILNCARFPQIVTAGVLLAFCFSHFAFPHGRNRPLFVHRVEVIESLSR